MSEQTLNIPQLLVVLALTFFAARWWFSSSSTSAPRSGGYRINQAHVEQVAQMFPQARRRDIMWDLQRNGGNVAATTERLLTGTGLARAPPSFQPPVPSTQQTSTPAAAGRTAAAARPAPAKPAYPDLITRYNLSSKITPSLEDVPNSSEGGSTLSSSSSEAAAKKAASAWGQNKNDRQQLLQRRREEMVLAARKKMLEKEQAK